MVGIVHNDIIKAAGVDTEPMPGFKKEIVLVLASDVDTVPELPVNPVTNAQRVTISDSLILKAGKKQFTVEAEFKYNTLKVTKVGGPGSALYKYELDFRLTGTSEDIEAFGRMVKNAEYFGNIEDMNSVKRFLGKDGLPFKIELSEGSMGEGPEDENGVFDAYKIIAYGVTPKPPRWTGSYTEGGSGSGS
jgi:hypothetical protein